MRVGDQLEWGENHHGTTGAAHFVSGEGEDECSAIIALRLVVEEITGKPVEPPPARRIGFY